MAINGVQTAVFGVDDLPLCHRFFTDFGLKASSQSDDMIEYRLAEGSCIVLRKSDDPSLPVPYSEGPGVREVIWGVDSKASLDAIEAELSHDRAVLKDANGTLHSVDDLGLAIGFRVFERKPLSAKEELVNSPGRAMRWTIPHPAAIIT